MQTEKAFALAAASLERTHDIKLRALGLDKDLPINDEMPVLTFRDLSDDEIKALHQNDGEDEAEPFVTESPSLALQDLDSASVPAEDDEIIVEGDEIPTSEDKTVFKDADGGRLVRGAQP